MKLRNKRLFNLIISDDEIIFEFKENDFINLFNGSYKNFKRQMKLMVNIVDKYKKFGIIKLNKEYKDETI